MFHEVPVNFNFCVLVVQGVNPPPLLVDLPLKNTFLCVSTLRGWGETPRQNPFFSSAIFFLFLSLFFLNFLDGGRGGGVIPLPRLQFPDQNIFLNCQWILESWIILHGPLIDQDSAIYLIFWASRKMYRFYWEIFATRHYI